MHISPGDYSKTFQEIKRTSLSHSTCKLVIFVACLDIDSLCSSRILSLIFKKELIQYQLIPVVGYTDLKGHFSNLDVEVANVILIGCGSMLDLESFFELDPSPDLESKRKIYVIDGHRPWNLDNLFGSLSVVCFDDGYVDLNLVDEKSSYAELVNYDDGDEDEEDEEKDENESEEEDGNEDEEEDANSDDDGPINHFSKKRKREAKQARILRKQRRTDISNHENVLETYYNQGTTIFTSTSAVVYSLLSLIGETSIDNLWLSIIGTSSLDNQYPQVYDKIQPLFKDEVIRLNPEHTSTSSSTITADTTSLSIDKDYHLFLLRHWTLYDSFFYSSHVNSKLNLWTEDGKKKLHKLFAKMGISLAIAQQKWLYVDIGIKKQLPLIFKKYLPLYGLEGVVREGFVRTFGYLGQLSAMECVESLTALLEAEKSIINRDGYTMPTSGASKNDSNNNNNNQDDEINTLIEKKEKIWVNNFWSAWDALNVASNNSHQTNTRKPKGLELLQSGLEFAKDIQQIIFRTGMSLLERKLIKNLRLYRLCVLNDGSIPDLSMFKNPIILTKLGGWLLENIAEIEFLQKKNGTLKPLVVASLDVSTDTYLVIGLAPKYPRGMANSVLMAQQKEKKKKSEDGDVTLTTRLNTFSVAFQQVAATSGAKVRIDSFDSSVIEIRKDDLSPFLERLTLSGLV